MQMPLTTKGSELSGLFFGTRQKRSQDQIVDYFCAVRGVIIGIVTL